MWSMFYTIMGSLLGYLVFSLVIGLVIGTVEYWRIKVDKERGYSCYTRRSKITNIFLTVIMFLFYSRIISSIWAIVLYPFKAWSRNVVYNHFFKSHFRYFKIKDLKVMKYSLKNERFKNGFYTMERLPNHLVHKNYKSKNMVVGYNSNNFMFILFPVAFMIWLYNNDFNTYDMSGSNTNNISIKNGERLKFIPQFIRDKCDVTKIGLFLGSYVAVGDNLISERAFVSFLLNRLFLSEYKSINIGMYFDIKPK